MAGSLQLVSAVYRDEGEAQTILGHLRDMDHGSRVELMDAAMLTKDYEGKLHIHESQELTGGKGAKRGAVVGALFGVVFPPSLIASTLVGGAAGVIAGKLRDTGIKSDTLKEMGEGLSPGDYAVVALAESTSVEFIEGALAEGQGRVVRQGFSSEDSAALEEAAEAAAAE